MLFHIVLTLTFILVKGTFGSDYSSGNYSNQVPSLFKRVTFTCRSNDSAVPVQQLNLDSHSNFNATPNSAINLSPYEQFLAPSVSANSFHEDADTVFSSRFIFFQSYVYVFFHRIQFLRQSETSRMPLEMIISFS